eukprot:COSAG02_NODE_3453_length_6714_cov_65.566591_4_plen_50_part_00
MIHHSSINAIALKLGNLELQEYANVVAELTELYNNHVAAFPRVHSQVSP